MDDIEFKLVKFLRRSEFSLDWKLIRIQGVLDAINHNKDLKELFNILLSRVEK